MYIYPPIIYNINVKKFRPNSDSILVTLCRSFIIETPKNLGNLSNNDGRFLIIKIKFQI